MVTLAIGAASVAACADDGNAESEQPAVVQSQPASATPAAPPASASTSANPIGEGSISGPTDGSGPTPSEIPTAAIPGATSAPQSSAGGSPAAATSSGGNGGGPADATAVSSAGAGGGTPGSGAAGSPSGGTGGVDGAPADAGGTAGATAGSGGSGDPAPPCPKPEGEICHAFFASDNSRHEIIYVDEFDPTKNWNQRTEDTASGNSPRQLELVDNDDATNGKAILVSVESGYEEYDTVSHELLARVDLGAISVRGAQRLPDGNTVLGIGDAKLRVVTPDGQTVGSECDLPGSGSDTLRVLSRDPESGDIYFGRGTSIFAVTLACEQQWTATFPDASSKAYRVLAREGGGAWAATGYPASVVEVDLAGQVVSEVGGLSEFPGVLDFSSGFELTEGGNVVMANWWGHVSPPPEEGPHVVEFDLNNQIVWRWGTQAEAVQITNLLLVR